MWLRSKTPGARGKVVSVGAITYSGGPRTGPALYVFERGELLRLKKDFASFRGSGMPEGGTYEARELGPYPGGRSGASAEAGLILSFKEISSIDE